MSQQDGTRLSDSIAGKLIQGGFPANLEFLRFNAALNIWEFVVGSGGGEANTISSQGGGLGLTATVSKLALDLRVRSLAGTAPISVSQAADLITIVSQIVTSALAGHVPASGGGTTNFLRADITWAAPPSGTGLWSVLGDYEAASAESSIEFDVTDTDFDDHSLIVVIIDGSTTGALNLLCRINQGAGAVYFTDGRRITGGTETIIDVSGTTSYQIHGDLDAADRKFAAVLYIQATKGATSDRIMLQCQAIDHRPTTEYTAGVFNTNNEIVTHVEILTSASTWKIGTRITVYRVSRA